MDSNYPHVLYAGIGTIFPRASCLGQSKMGRGRSSRHAIDGLAGFPFSRISLDSTLETYDYYCESKIQNPGCLTSL